LNYDYLRGGKSDSIRGSNKLYTDQVSERMPTINNTTTTILVLGDATTKHDADDEMFLAEENESDYEPIIIMKKSNPIAVPRNHAFANYWRARYARNVDVGRKRRDYTLDELESLIRKAQREEDRKNSNIMVRQQQHQLNYVITPTTTTSTLDIANSTTTATTTSTTADATKNYDSDEMHNNDNMFEESTSEYDTSDDGFDEYDFDETSEMQFHLDL
jgi:hypothetical protein